MVRYIPGKTRVKTEFMKNITFGDIILAIICLVFAVVIVASNLFKIGGVDYRWYALLGWLAISVVFYLPIDQGLRLYNSIGLIIRFTAFPKKYIQIDNRVSVNSNGKKKKKQKGKSIEKLTPFLSIDQGKFINFVEYAHWHALKLISQYQRATLIKNIKPMRFDRFLRNDDRKYELLNRLYEMGYYTELEMERRGIIFRERVERLNNAIKAEPIPQSHFYLVLYGADRPNLEDTAIAIVNDLGSGQYPIGSQILLENELISF